MQLNLESRRMRWTLNGISQGTYNAEGVHDPFASLLDPKDDDDPRGDNDTQPGLGVSAPSAARS